MKNKKKLLFLTNNDNTEKLLEYLCRVEDEVQSLREPFSLEDIKIIDPYYIVSYNYKFIIKQEVIDYMKGNIINLHISYLPWNRGASSNVWSFLEDTPKGVTIHYINKELDKGGIIIRKRVEFNEQLETFESSYEKLHEEIQILFQQNWAQIKENAIIPYFPKETGNYHSISDFQDLYERCPFSWKEKISDVKQRYFQTIRKE